MLSGRLKWVSTEVTDLGSSIEVGVDCVCMHCVEGSGWEAGRERREVDPWLLVTAGCLFRDIDV